MSYRRDMMEVPWRKKFVEWVDVSVRTCRRGVEYKNSILRHPKSFKTPCKRAMHATGWRRLGAKTPKKGHWVQGCYGIVQCMAAYRGECNSSS
jgi:hypothetical protein